MKRLYALLAGISMLSAACGSSSESSGTAASAASAATTPATDAPSTEAPPAAAPAAPVVPSVVCIQFNFDVYFAYDNQSTSVVAVDAADSVVAGGDPADEPFATTLFAPGTVSPAFLVQAGGPPESISWQLTGPDGIVRTATPDADTPSCTPELLEPTTPEPRTPGFTTGAVLNDAGDTVELTLELTGVPPTSVCNAAFTAEPAQIQLQQAQGMDEPLVFEGTTATSWPQ